jgi:hypothetical protein
MAVTKKPLIDADKADEFIGGAKADAVKPQKRDNGQTVISDTVKTGDQIEGNPLKRDTINTVNSIDDNTENRNTAKPQMRETVKPVKKTKLTFYMNPEMYLKWKTYELEQLQAGKKVTFQGVVEKYMNKILR